MARDAHHSDARLTAMRWVNGVRGYGRIDAAPYRLDALAPDDLDFVFASWLLVQAEVERRGGRAVCSQPAGENVYRLEAWVPDGA